MKDGYDFVKGLNDFEALSQQSLGVKLTVQGFLAFFYSRFGDAEDDAGEEDMKKLFDLFQETTKPVEALGPKLQEHLISIALHTAEDNYYGQPDAESVGTALVESGDESDTKKPRLDKP